MFVSSSTVRYAACMLGLAINKKRKADYKPENRERDLVMPPPAQ